ncbi:MAG: uncharacterized protein QG585_663 [Patescibacteria group bacterium]|jgi:uncharacterized protein YggE|nr:uncharacterized protein [Patescibacteria group bacterium]
MNDNKTLLNSPLVVKSAVAVLVLLAAFLLVKTITQIRTAIEGEIPTYNSVTINGVGEVFAVPDIAMFTYTVSSEASTVAEAQRVATEKHNVAIKTLRDAGIEDKDIVAVPNLYPKYSYNYRPCTALSCPSNQTISGYEATFGVTVKVRESDKTSELISKVTEAGATGVSGITYTIDDEEVLKAEARSLAIADAKAKAEKLSKDLGVDLEEIISYYDNENSGPVYDSAEGMGGAMMMKASAPAPVADLPKGENQIRVNVSVTYKID